MELSFEKGDMEEEYEEESDNKDDIA